MSQINDKMNEAFGHSYYCEQLQEAARTASHHHYFYPNASIQGGRDGILIRVQPEGGQVWLGTFAGGKISVKGVSGIFAMPDPERLCVVSRGEGYIVSALTPTSWETVRAAPIIDVRPVRAQGIIIFANFTELVAYDQKGIKWRTKRLTWDGLKLTEVTDTYIKGEFWDIRNEALANFVVDLATGDHQGGIREI